MDLITVMLMVAVPATLFVFILDRYDERVAAKNLKMV
jgi:hypothetical protein